MMTLAAKWPKMLLDKDVEELFAKIVKKYGKQYDKALLKKVFDKFIAKKMKEGKLIVI
jgi:hypothetical protein